MFRPERPPFSKRRPTSSSPSLVGGESQLGGAGADSWAEPTPTAGRSWRRQLAPAAGLCPMISPEHFVRIVLRSCVVSRVDGTKYLSCLKCSVLFFGFLSYINFRFFNLRDVS